MDDETSKKLQDRNAVLITYRYHLSTHRFHDANKTRGEQNLTILKNILKKGDDSKDEVKTGGIVNKKGLLENDFVAVTSGDVYEMFEERSLNKSQFKLIGLSAFLKENGKEENFTGKVLVPKIACEDDAWTLTLNMAVLVAKKGIDYLPHCELIKFSNQKILEKTRKLFKVGFNGYRKTIVAESIIETDFEAHKGFFIYTNGTGRNGTSASLGCDYLGQAATLWDGEKDWCAKAFDVD